MSDDETAAQFVIANMTAGGPKLSPCAMMMLASCRTHAFKEGQRISLRKQIRPDQPIDLLIAIPRMPMGPADPLGKPQMPLVNLLAHADVLNAPLGKQEEFKAFFRQQIDAIRFQMAVAKELEKDDRNLLSKKMRDPNPLMRWLAIQSASQRRVPCEEELIQRLKDRVPAIRQSAHQALMRLSRGADFGPYPSEGASPVALRRAQDEAVANWQQFVRSQRGSFGSLGQK